MATKEALDFDAEPIELIQNVTLAVTLLCTGMVLGLTVAGKIALYHYPAVLPRPWVGTINIAIYATGGVAMGGFVLLLCLDYIDS